MVIACGVLLFAYGLGLGLALVLLPSMLYLYRLHREEPPETAAVTRNPDLGWAAVAIAGLVIFSSVITFVGVCAPTGAYAISGLAQEGNLVQTLVWVSGLIGGLLAAGGVSYGLIRLLFRRGSRRDEPWEPPNIDVRA
ncbi:MAG TPA: hypothetical protein VMS17_15195 [Gemmataceae bacterium]|nr:hypothetical protein [Gemmataceae bacterium]